MSTVSKFALLGLHIYVSVRYVRMDVSLWVRLVCGSIGLAIRQAAMSWCFARAWFNQ